MKHDLLALALLLLAPLPVLHAGEHHRAEHPPQRSTPKERAADVATDLTPTELALKKLLGDATPDPIRLWPDKPPGFAANAPPETVDQHARIRMISVPTITPYLPPKDRRVGQGAASESPCRLDALALRSASLQAELGLGIDFSRRSEHAR